MWFLHFEVFGPEPPFIHTILVYSEPGYLHKLAYSKYYANSELCQTCSMRRFARIVDQYNYFCGINLLRSLFHEINVMNLF